MYTLKPNQLLGAFNKLARTSKTHVLPDMCKCSTCGKAFYISECPQEYGHHDGWEMPAYTEISCPECEDGGCVDDFFYSDEANLEYRATMGEEL